MIEIDVKQLKKYENDLKTFAAKAYPYATRETVNRAAKNTSVVAKSFIRGRMILRNRWTEGSVQVAYERSLVVAQQAARVGSVMPYMEVQEFGGVKYRKGARGVPIPTPESSGEATLPRRKLPKRSNSLAAISLRQTRTRAASRQQRNRIAIAEAAEQGGRARFVFLDLGRRSGIFRVTGGKRRPRLVKLYGLGRPSVVIPRRPWLLPATRRIEPQIPRYYAQALAQQLQRRGLFKP